MIKEIVDSHLDFLRKLGFFELRICVHVVQLTTNYFREQGDLCLTMSSFGTHLNT